MTNIGHALRRLACRWLGHRFDLKSKKYRRDYLDPCEVCSRCRFVNNLAPLLLGLEFYEFDDATQAEDRKR